MAVSRFTNVQKGFHLLLLVSFLIQAATGTARMYIETSFGKNMASVFGGYEGCLEVHRIVGLFMIALFLLHLLYVVVWVLPKTRLGPDSLVPKPRDFRDFLKHLRWMLGGKKTPEFERWRYWEKFDYWAVFWGMLVMGGTGLMLYNPVATTRVMDGSALNVAFWIHRIEAILAMLHVFIIHFVIAHLRRAHFPMDMAMFSGDASETSVREESSQWVERLESQGAMDSVTTPGAKAPARVVSYVIGIVALATGIYILVGGLIYARHITW